MLTGGVVKVHLYLKVSFIKVCQACQER